MAPTELRTELLRICGSQTWAERVAQSFPHTTPASALDAMDRVRGDKGGQGHLNDSIDDSHDVYVSNSIPSVRGYPSVQVWGSLGRDDYLEAFAAHPRIGDAAALRKVFGKYKYVCMYVCIDCC